MEASPPDWTTFTRRILISAPIAEVYDAWASPAKMEVWFLLNATALDHDSRDKSKSELYQKGDIYKWTWHGWPDHTQDGKILTAVPNKEIGFTFGEAGNVLVSFKESDGRTELQLTQSDIPTNDLAKYQYYYGCTNGWSFWMINLKAYLEHGILLDERSEAHQCDMSVVNQ